MTIFKNSNHINKHLQEKWNALTVRELIEDNQLEDKEFLEGNTADVICGVAPDGVYVGLIVGKEKDGVRIVVTGFEAPKNATQTKTATTMPQPSAQPSPERR